MTKAVDSPKKNNNKRKLKEILILNAELQVKKL